MIQQLRDLRDTSVALDITIIRGLMIAMITHHAPEIFERVDKQGRHFECPELYVRRFLKRHLGWSIQRSTRAGHKFPADVEDVCRRFFLRNAVTIRNEDIIHPCFIVNSDQTQVLYSSGGRLTWAPTNSKQVPVVGMDDKRAFTLMVGVSLNGEVLPFQAIYQGVDVKKSLPQLTAQAYDEAMRLRFRLELSKTKTYWSTMGTMKSYVIFILAPFFDHWRTFHNRPTQKCIWNIDVWSVHRSIEFRTWMKSQYAWIIIIFIPGGCTPLLQACDVGIQKILKIAIKKSSHADVVEETLSKLKDGMSPASVQVQKKLGILRDRSVKWLVDGYKAINKADIVKKVSTYVAPLLPRTDSLYVSRSQAFRLCQAGPFNLSFESLTSLEARQALNELRQSDPEFYTEITSGQTPAAVPSDPDGEFAEDVDEATVAIESIVEEDAAMKLSVVKSEVLQANSAAALQGREEDTYSDSDVDVEVPGDEPAGEDVPGNPEEDAALPAKRRRKPSTRYTSAEWVRLEGSDSDDD